MINGLFLRFAEKNNEAFLCKVRGYIRAVDNPGQMKLQFGLVIQVNGFYVQVQILFVVLRMFTLLLNRRRRNKGGMRFAGSNSVSDLLGLFAKAP